MNSNFIYKQTQKAFTEDEKKRLINSGMIFLSLENYKNLLLTFGLKLETKGALKYYNNLNPHLGQWLECAADAIDETNFSYANIYGKFYQEEIKKRTQNYLNFKEFRNTYFTQLKTGHLINI
jgi:hypothetical protein